MDEPVCEPRVRACDCLPRLCRLGTRHDMAGRFVCPRKQQLGKQALHGHPAAPQRASDGPLHRAGTKLAFSSPVKQDSHAFRGWDLSPLTHPLWWCALALLLVNDRLLKGSGIVPGWLTGKLSDFAFLVVAPVLAAVLLPRAVPARHWLATLAVASIYAAAEVSQAVANGVTDIAALLGLRWRLWADLSDLFALVVLPLSLQVMRARPRQLPRRAAPRWLVQRVGLLVGAFACLATSDTRPPGQPHQPFIVNRTESAATIRVTWILRNVTTPTTPEALAESLRPSDLDDAREFDLDSGEAATLAGPFASGVSPAGQCWLDSRGAWPFTPVMSAAILESAGASPVLMLAPAGWMEFPENAGGAGCQRAEPGPSPVSRCRARFEAGEAVGRDAVSLLQVDGRGTFVVDPTPIGPVDRSYSQPVQIAPVDLGAIGARADTPDGCRFVRARYAALFSSASACSDDADCTELNVGEGAEFDACEVYLPKRDATAAGQLLDKWRSACLWSPYCQPPQPAACRHGRCEAACPDDQVRACPGPCPNAAAATPGGRCADPWPVCANAAGESCACDLGVVSCQQPAPDSSACSLRCTPSMPWPVGGGGGS